MSRPHLFWGLIKPYWCSTAGRFGWLLLFVTIILQILSTYAGVQFAQWNNDFFSALETKLGSAIYPEIINFVLLLSFMSLVAVNRTYFLRWLKLHWRRWMSEHYTSDWLADNRFYHIHANRNIDNIDQRIGQDIALFTDETLDLAFDCFDALLSIGSFSVVLWTLSGTLDFSLGGQQYSIEGYLVYGAFIYAALGFVFARFIGRPIHPLTKKRQKVEADYRRHLMTITEHNEALALSGAGEIEKRSLHGYFGEIYGNTMALMKADRRLNLYTLCYGQAMFIAPLLAAMPQFIAGTLTLGALMELRIAFSQVVGSLSWFTNNYDRLMAWYATMDRVADVQRELLRPLPTPEQPPLLDERQLAVSDFELSRPNGDALFSLPQWQLQPGQHCHLNGRSGLGKTSFTKALCGLWPWYQGQITRPSSMMVISQRDYIPFGTLKQAMVYPYGEQQFEPSAFVQALQQVGLSSLVDRIDEQQDWYQLLSGGERQRLVLAKCFLLKPKWLLLDEAFSGLDQATGTLILQRLLHQLADSAVLCISHAPWTQSFFNHQLDLNGVTPCNPSSTQAIG